ncbi:MAG: hypothetical protein OEM96_02345, partial [Gemmatimonadota bacterium]|nr:hypothetical protein [Gemmatimonadota bacterium]
VPGSPLRSLWFGESADSALVPPTDVGSTDSSLPAGASISVRPSDGALRVRVRDFPAGTRIRITPADGQVGVASLPDGEANARFVVAAGMLEVVGPGRDAAPASGDGVILQLPRELRSGVVEVDGDIVARVSGGRIVAQRQVSASGDGGVVIEVGG